jgi:molybdenum cofactor cytidylyltransferase
MPNHPHPSTSTPAPWSAVLLAAGEGRRLGGVAKALIRLQGQTLLARQLALLQAAKARRVVVVTSPAHHAAIEAAATAFAASQGGTAAGQAPFTIQLVCNPNAALGQSGSVRCGLTTLLAATRSGTGAAPTPAPQPIAMLLVDLPLLTATDVLALLQAWQHTPHHGCLVPRHRGQRGHPVLLSLALARDVLHQPEPLAVREHLQRNPALISHIDVAHNHCTTDLDTPEQCTELARHTGWHLAMPP